MKGTSMNTAAKLILILSIATPSLASASDAAYRQAARQRSADAALGGATVRRFEQKPPVANPQRRGELVNALVGARLVAEQPLAEADQDWKLDVSDDGTHAEFEFKRQAKRGGARWTVQRRPAAEEVEATARMHIARLLGTAVRLGPNEELKAWTVVNNIESAMSAHGEHKEELKGSTLIFTRVIDGLPVLDTSSRVSVTFWPDGSLRGYAYDWPEFALMDQVSTVDAEVGRGRRAAVREARKLGATNGPAQEDSTECGYFAKVHPARRVAVLEPVCVSTYSRETGSMRSVYRDVIPMAQTIQEKSGWVEAEVIRSQAD